MICILIIAIIIVVTGIALFASQSKTPKRKFCEQDFICEIINDDEEADEEIPEAKQEELEIQMQEIEPETKEVPQTEEQSETEELPETEELSQTQEIVEIEYICEAEATEATEATEAIDAVQELSENDELKIEEIISMVEEVIPTAEESVGEDIQAETETAEIEFAATLEQDEPQIIQRKK